MTNLERLNNYRQAQGLDPITAWRPARHQHLLDSIVVPWEIDQAAAEASSIKEVDIPDPLKDAINSHDFADKAIEDAVRAAKIPPYKTFARYDASAVDKPCAFVHQFLSDHPTLTRKQAMHALMQYGVNYSTARTQYQKWFANRPATLLVTRCAATNAPDKG